MLNHRQQSHLVSQLRTKSVYQNLRKIAHLLSANLHHIVNLFYLVTPILILTETLIIEISRVNELNWKVNNLTTRLGSKSVDWLSLSLQLNTRVLLLNNRHLLLHPISNHFDQFLKLKFDLPQQCFIPTQIHFNHLLSILLLKIRTQPGIQRSLLLLNIRNLLQNIFLLQQPYQLIQLQHL